MSLVAADSFFQVIRVAPICQHIIAVIGFQEDSMALTEILNHSLAGIADICNNTNIHPIAGNHETMRIISIMTLSKRNDRQSANFYCYAVTK